MEDVNTVATIVSEVLSAAALTDFALTLMASTAVVSSFYRHLESSDSCTFWHCRH